MTQQKYCGILLNVCPTLNSCVDCSLPMDDLLTPCVPPISYNCVIELCNQYKYM